MRNPAIVLSLVAALALAGCRADREKAPPPKPNPLDGQIRVVTRPSQTVLSLPYAGPYAEMDVQIERLLSKMERDGIEPTGYLQGVFYDDPETTPPERTRYEVWMPVAPTTEAAVPFSVKEIPATKIAAIVLVGPYERISERYDQIYDWIEQNGYEAAGPLEEVYLVNPSSGVGPDEYETEVHVPIRAR